VSDPIFRLVCVPGALDGAPEGWASKLLQEGEIALLVDDGGLPAINAAAHSLGLATVPVVRIEDTATAQEQTVIAYAEALPVVWVAPEFSASTRTWAHDRRPMTLLVEAEGPLADDARGRIERFVGWLGRQTE
jgi:NADPH-dependent ferric siderophore reductase